MKYQHTSDHTKHITRLVIPPITSRHITATPTGIRSCSSLGHGSVKETYWNLDFFIYSQTHTLGVVNHRPGSPRSHMEGIYHFVLLPRNLFT